MFTQEKKVVVLTASIVIALIVLLIFGGRYIYTIGSSPLRDVQLTSGVLYGGPLPTSPTCSTTTSAYYSLSLTNPSESTNISRIAISGGSLTTTINSYYMRNAACTLISPTHEPGVVGGGANTSLVVYFGGKAASNLIVGQTFNWVINFTSYPSMFGSLVAK